MGNENGFILDETGTVLVKYTGDSKDVVVPDGVEVIESTAFDGVGIESLKLPESVWRIEAYDTEAYKNLRMVDCSVKQLCDDSCEFDSAFLEAPKLRDKDGFLIINGVLLDYGDNGFESKIPDTVEIIGPYALESIYLLGGGVTIPKSVKAVHISNEGDIEQSGIHCEGIVYPWQWYETYEELLEILNGKAAEDSGKLREEDGVNIVDGVCDGEADNNEYMWLLHLSTNINTGGWMCRPEEKGFSVWLYDSFEKAKKEMFGLIREWYYETSNDIFDKGNIVPLNKWLEEYCTEDNEDSDALKALPKLIKTYIDNEGIAADEVEDCQINTDKGYLSVTTLGGYINFSGEKDRERVFNICDVTVEISNFKANEGYLKFYFRDRDTLGEIFEFGVVIMKLEINEFREKFGGPMYAD